MGLHEENEVLNWLDAFSVPVIPRTTRFWMIRTKKGYFYNEFISKRFVALAWNNITQNTDFSESSRDSLKDDILIIECIPLFFYFRNSVFRGMCRYRSIRC